MSQKLSVLLVDEDVSRRMRLKQAIAHEKAAKSIEGARTLKEAYSRLSNDESCDVVFIDSSYGHEIVQKFLLRAKESRQGACAAFVLLLKPDDHDGASIADRLLKGADGLLLEPFTTEGIQGIIELATKVRAQKLRARQEAALRLIGQDSIFLIDRIARSKKAGKVPLEEVKALQKIGQTVAGLGPDMHPLYFDTVIPLFERARPAHTASEMSKDLIYALAVPQVTVKEVAGQDVPDIEAVTHFATSEDGPLDNNLSVTLSPNKEGKLDGTMGSGSIDDLMAPALEGSGLVFSCGKNGDVKKSREVRNTMLQGFGFCVREMEDAAKEHGVSMTGKVEIDDESATVSVEISQAEGKAEGRVSLGRDLRRNDDDSFMLQRSAARSLVENLSAGGQYNVRVTVDRLANVGNFLSKVGQQIGKALSLTS